MLTAQIGEDAGVVWRALEGKGSMNLETLQEITGIDSTALCAAIGWLAREGKVSFNKENGVTTIRLYQERYY